MYSMLAIPIQTQVYVNTKSSERCMHLENIWYKPVGNPSIWHLRISGHMRWNIYPTLYNIFSREEATQHTIHMHKPASMEHKSRQIFLPNSCKLSSPKLVAPDSSFKHIWLVNRKSNKQVTLTKMHHTNYEKYKASGAQPDCKFTWCS